MTSLVPALALASALCSAGATILIRQGLRGGNTYGGFWINLVVGTVTFWSAVLLVGPMGPISVRGIALFALTGLVGTIAGRFLRFVSIQRVGASVAAAVMSLYPFVSSALAILLLGERVTPPVVAGTVVIVVGTILLSASGRRVGFRPRHLLLPFAAATCFGIVTVLRKVGLSGVGPVLGFAVNVTTALVAFSAFLVASGNTGAIVCRGRSLVYFIIAGVAENLGVFLTVLALGFGTVSVVTPLSGTSPIFVLVMSLAFLRGVETLTARVVLGTLLTVLGVYMITAL
jgi:drug/metabolite transporter (DMT)-like permease